MSAHDPIPSLEYEPSPCPQCGAVTFIEAETKCTARQQMDGDYYCAGTDCPETDPQGRMLFPTQVSLTALGLWYERDAARQEIVDAAEGGTLSCRQEHSS